tara:strand:- start:5444 stop:6967 length:1524 start_codon:yes stop_codon:yes gene_type:complete
MIKIFAVALNQHDHNTYDGVWHNERSRHTRFKHNLPYHAEAYGHQFNTGDTRLIEEFAKEYFKKPREGVLSFSMTVGGLKPIKEELFNTILKGHEEILDFKPKNLWDYYYKDNIYYIDHHQAHATYALIQSGFNESDILAIDGIGYNFRCIFIDKNNQIKDLSNELPIGWLWNHMSKLTGFGSLGASKLMGLVGYGKFSQYYYDIFETILAGEITEKKQPMHGLIKVEEYGKPDLAFTLQKFTIDKIKEYIYPLKTCDYLCVSGGVAYNGYMNEEFTKHYEQIFVPPAVGDEGQSIGVYQHAFYMLNKMKVSVNDWGGKEYPYRGGSRDWNYKEIAQAIADGKIVGWFKGRSESGNRALGQRSIFADPRRKDIKDVINQTIKMREDFRPFAPVVMEDHYENWFDTIGGPSPYMSRIVKVNEDKKSIVPGITHIDGTARIQTVHTAGAGMLDTYNLIDQFYKITGVPMLLNTSFNCQEPIVETPEDAIRTFEKTALDILVINDRIIRK